MSLWTDAVTIELVWLTKNCIANGASVSRRQMDCSLAESSTKRVEDAWRLSPSGERPEWMADWMMPSPRRSMAAKKYVVSSTLEQVDWNAELLRGDLATRVEELKRLPGKGLFVKRSHTAAGSGGIGTDRRVRVRRASQARRPRPNIVRRPFEVCRSEIDKPQGVQLWSGSAAVSAEIVLNVLFKPDRILKDKNVLQLRADIFGEAFQQ